MALIRVAVDLASSISFTYLGSAKKLVEPLHPTSSTHIHLFVFLIQHYSG